MAKGRVLAKTDTEIILLTLSESMFTLIYSLINYFKNFWFVDP